MVSYRFSQIFPTKTKPKPPIRWQSKKHLEGDSVCVAQPQMLVVTDGDSGPAVPTGSLGTTSYSLQTANITW